MCETLEGFERKGYDYPFLTLTFTNEWRCDNDGPMPQLLAFIKNGMRWVSSLCCV